jgi:hypothetical protein
MNRRLGWIFSLFAIGAAAWLADSRLITPVDAATKANVAAREVEFFEAARNGDIEEKFIAMSDRKARLIVTNKTKQPLNIQLPEAFAAVPVLAQFGGGGGGGGQGGGGGGGGGGQQTGGGGFGGGGGGGGGGGQFSIPPESTAKINVAMVCLDHGLRDPSSSKPYKIVAAEGHIENPAVIELLKGFGRGELHHGAAQAAAWHLNSEMPWDQLAAKQTGTERNINRSPYFSRDELQAGMMYAAEAVRRAEAAEADKDADEPKDEAVEEDTNDSEARSTQD